MLITAEQARMQVPELEGTSQDTTFETLITRVGVAFARHCGYPGNNPTLESASYISYLDGPGGRDLVLDVWPATAISSIYDDLTQDFSDSQFLVSSSDYVLLDNKIVRLKSTSTKGRWSQGKKCIKVTYTAGYTSIPDDLKQLAVLAVKNWWELRTIQTRSNTSQSGVSVGFRDEEFLPAFVKQGLSSFKLQRAWL